MLKDGNEGLDRIFFMEGILNFPGLPSYLASNFIAKIAAVYLVDVFVNSLSLVAIHD